MKGYVKEWRKLKVLRPQKVDGTELHDVIIGSCETKSTGFCTIGPTIEDWLEKLTPQEHKGIILRDGSNSKSTVLQLRLGSKRWRKK